MMDLAIVNRMCRSVLLQAAGRHHFHLSCVVDEQDKHAGYGSVLGSADLVDVLAVWALHCTDRLVPTMALPFAHTYSSL